jgi:hypothetical protein
MQTRQEPKFDPEAAARAVADSLPGIETPVIDIQDLEHKPGPDTRVNNSGIEVQPDPDPDPADRPMTEEQLAEADEAALEALAKFEESLKKLPPD